MFEPEELMARIIDLEEQLKVSEMAPPAAEQLIACLEGEIAKRDETIARLEADNRSKNGSLKAFGEQIAGLQKAVRNRERLVGLRDARILELESQYQRDVCGLNNEGDPIGGDPAGGYANDNARLRSELAAIKAQDTVGEVVGWYRLDRPYEMTSYPSVCATWHKLGAPVAPLYAAPAAPAADALLVEALDYQVLFDAIAAATSVYANGAVNISVQAFRDALAAHCAKVVV